MKKVVKKMVKQKPKNISKSNSDVLEVVLDLKDLMIKKFQEQKEKINDSNRSSLAFTELKFDDVVGILKDERQINKERYNETKTKMEEYDKEFSKLNFKIDHVIDKIDNLEERLEVVEVKTL